ncbi:MAG: carboxypeptidase regulatory-like domain-containing protein [Thermoplasmata archaeon]|nr:carboxypeptidase regulatory-like domain-containing protein [Thermoplasmata archaeon]
MSARVSTCPLGGTYCSVVLHGGVTGTGGTYAAEVTAGGPFPLGTYEIEASAPGYVSNSTWINVTAPGAVVNVPPIRLASFLQVAAESSNERANPEEYLVGDIVDNASGVGVDPAVIDLTPTSGGPTSVLQGAENTGGFFNYTVPAGTYWANVSEPDYAPVSLFLNVSGLQPRLDLGRIALAGFPGYVSGIVQISPWSSLTTQYGLAPGEIDVTVCQATNPTICGEAPAGSGGRYNVSAPWGIRDVVSFNPVVIVGAGVGGAPYGFPKATARATVDPGVRAPYLTTGLTIFGAVVGAAWDESTNDTTPVAFASVGVTVQNPLYGKQSATEISGGSGEFTAIVPPGTVTGAVAGTAFVAAPFSSPTDVANVTAGNVSVVTPLSVPHDGWITGRILPAVPPADEREDWVDGAIVSASTVAPAAFYSTNNGYFNILSGNLASDTGQFNITAPPSDLDTLDIVAPDYSQLIVENLRVNQSATTALAPGSLPTLVAWGWTTGTVLDPTIDQPSAGAEVAVSDLSETLRSNPLIVSSTSGRFVTDAPPGDDLLTARHLDDRTNLTEVTVASGAFTDVGTVEVAGWGLLSSTVVDPSSGLSIDGANVSVCPLGTPFCTNDSVTASGTGGFWAAAPPGTDVLTVSFPGFNPNATTVVEVAPDSFQTLPPIELTPFATVTGRILGSPSGLALEGANASLCAAPLPPAGAPPSPCFAEVPTDAAGQFTLSIGSGLYVLALSDAGYSPSYVTVAIAPAEQVGLGDFLLAQDGTITGTVVGTDSQAPIPGTVVNACSAVVSGCSGEVEANATGSFLVSVEPGLYIVTASAPGYQDGYAAATVRSSLPSDLGILGLIPIGPSTPFQVSGTVRAAATGLPIPGVIVEAGGYASSPALPNGSYQLALPYGSYDLVARAAGYSPGSEVITVDANLTGVDFELHPTAYDLYGTVVEGLTSAPVRGATLQLGTDAPFATTNSSGQFDAPFGNGTYLVTILPPAAINDSSVTLSISINGASVERNVSLYPPLTTVEGLVVNSQTGLPVANATVAVTGVTISGVNWSRTYPASALGSLDLSLYQGRYSLNASAGGYLSLQQNLTASGAIQPVVFALSVASPVTGHGSSPNSPDGFLELLLVAMGIVAGLGVAAILIRRSRTGVDAELGPEIFSKVLNGASTSNVDRSQVQLRCASCGTDFDAPSGPPADRRPAALVEELSYAAVCPSCGKDVEYPPTIPRPTAPNRPAG